ncbi:MAG: N-methyl-L-tryptophan oxidase, partial [Planctomycetaceae bacterium]
MSRTADVIVWGLGGMGSAVAWRLAQAGARVLGFDQFGPAHDRGSSHGETRIIRKAYFEHPHYVPLLRRAYQLWAELEAETQRSLFVRSGLFIAGNPASEAVVGTRQAATDHHLPLDRLTPTEARREFPPFHFEDHDEVVFEADAGYLLVEECVRAQLDVAARHHADLRFHTPLRDWQVVPGGVRVRTATDEFHAGRLVVTAGPWAAGLLPGLQVVRKPAFWFPLETPRVPGGRDAAFFFDLPEGQIYGFPSRDGATFKVAEHTGGELVADPLHVDRQLAPRDLAVMRRFLEERRPGAGREPTGH